MTWFTRFSIAVLYLGFLYIGWWPVAMLIGIAIAYVLQPYELAVAGLMLDIWFAAVASQPGYFLLGVGLCLLSLFIMPYVRVRTTRGPLRI